MTENFLISGMILEHLKLSGFRQPFWHLTTLRFWRLISGMNPNPYILIVVEKPTEKNAIIFSDTLYKFAKEISEEITGEAT